MVVKRDKSRSDGQTAPAYFQTHPWHVLIVVVILFIAVIFVAPKTGLNGVQKEVAPKVEEPKGIQAPKEQLPAGAASFQSLQKLRTEHGYSVAAADFNNDGKTDFVVGNYNQPSLVYLNRGGSFESSAVLGEAKYTTAVAVGDINNDGWQDIVLSNSKARSDVWLNNKDGTFKQVHLPGTELLQACCVDSAFGSVVVADFNGDGKQDVAIASDRKIMMFFGDGSENFQSKDMSDIQHTTALAAGDINGDGKIDLVVGTDFSKNYVLVNKGDGTFEKSALPDDLYHTTSIELADIDKDGKLDIVIGNNNQPNLIYYNKGNNEFKQTLLDTSASYTYSISVADLNNDGYPDVVAGNFNQKSYYYINRHDGTFDKQLLSDVSHVRGVAASDVDADRDVDIFLARDNDPSEIYKNTLVS